MRVISVILGMILVSGGFSMMLTPGITFLSIGWILGFVFIVSGINLVIDYAKNRKDEHINLWDLIAGLLAIVLGVLILISPYVMIVAKVLSVYVFTFWMIASGLLRFISSFQARKNGDRGWIWSLLLSLFTIAIGVYALFNILISALAMGWLLGFYVLLSGMNLISIGFASGKQSAGASE